MDGDQRIEQLERDLAEAIERQAATSQVLEAIGRGASELEPVFETVLRQAVRLCRADAGLIHVLQEGAYWVASALGGSAEYRDYLRSVPIVPGPGTLVGRVGQERRTVQIPDVLADPDYRMHRARELGGFRTILGVPMLAAERVVGVMVLWRHKVAPFDARTIGLVDDVRRAGGDRDPERRAAARAAAGASASSPAPSTSSARWGRSARRSARRWTSTRC